MSAGRDVRPAARAGRVAAGRGGVDAAPAAVLSGRAPRADAADRPGRSANGRQRIAGCAAGLRGLRWRPALRLSALKVTALEVTALGLCGALWLGGLALPAAAEVPGQAGWDAARQKVRTADGVTLAYVELGAAADAARGEPVILIHGYTDNSRSWSLMAPDLARALPGRRIVALDLRGHGASDAPACCYGPDSLAHDVAGLMDALGIAHADVVGHSLGSITAAYLAATEPGRVHRLVLIGSATALPAEPQQWLSQNVSALSAPIDPHSPFMDEWFTNPEPVDPSFLDRERAEAARVTLPVWRQVLAALSITDWTPLAPRIEAPAAILWGDKDPLFDSNAQDRLHAALPQARTFTLTGAGHNLFWERPAEAAGIVGAFLGE